MSSRKGTLGPSAPEPRDLIAVGRLGRPVGLKGEMTLEVLGESQERIGTLEALWVGATPQGVVSRRMEGVRVTPKTVVVKLSGVDSRSDAEGCRAQYVFVNLAESPGPAAGRYFVHDLIGLEAVDEQGVRVGTITDVQKLPAQDVWIIDKNGREIMIPAVREFVREVDLEAGRVVIRAIEGLIDEN